MRPSAAETCPTVVLLLNMVRRVDAGEAAAIVAAELGAVAAKSVTLIGGNSTGMQYIDWRVGTATYHLGTSSTPYLPMTGVAKANQEGVFGPVKWTIREEVPPDDERACRAWMEHVAWLYVDALLFGVVPSEAQTHRQNVLRIAGRLIDERCLLVWRCGPEPKQVALPTPATVESLRTGKWPG